VGINKGTKFGQHDVFVDYPFEKVMFRWDHLTKKVYRKFYSESEFKTEIEPANNLFNQALMHGLEISQDEYLKGK
jgi:hypothetical protein